jgi:hypothetical protein
MHVVRDDSSCCVLGDAWLRALAHRLLLLLCCRNDPGGLQFRRHRGGKHLCYRSNNTSESTAKHKPCSACGKVPPASDDDDATGLADAQHWRCFQSAEKECMDWIICRSCLHKCELDTRKRTYGDGGMAPPALDALPCNNALDEPEALNGAVVAVEAAYYAAFHYAEDVDSDSYEECAADEQSPSKKGPAAAAPQAGKKGLSKSNKGSKKERAAASDAADKQVSLLEIPAAVESEIPEESPHADMTRHHFFYIISHPDLRCVRFAQYVKHSEEWNHFHLGASKLYYASFHGYVTMELDLIYLVLDPRYKIDSMPLRVDWNQLEDYDVDTNVHGRSAIFSTSFVSSRSRAGVCACL